MANAKKLASGSWRVQASKVINNKKIIKSFTVNPSETGGDSRKAKALAEMKAREWQIEVQNNETYGKKISEVLDDYIKGREKVLSPRTIYDYKRLIPFFESIKDIFIDDIKSADIQALINEWSISVKCKTIQNRISFLLSALDYSECDKKFRLRYPQKTSKKVTAPDTEVVQILLSNADEILKLIIALAAFGSLRRGEIAAIKRGDISLDMNTVYIHADVVKTDSGWRYKDIPKTSSSVRTVQLPKFVFKMLPDVSDPNAFIFSLNPNQISHRYDNLCKKLGIDYSLHTLRHYAASFRSDLQIPSKYIEEVGGWKKDSAILQSVYDNSLESSRKKYTRMANDFIENNFKEAFNAKKREA